LGPSSQQEKQEMTMASPYSFFRRALEAALLVASCLGFAGATPVRAQSVVSRDGRGGETMIQVGPGVAIGVSVRNAEAGNAGTEGVVVENVTPDGPADRAGLKKADVIAEFDGERVRSTQQFARLVRETPPGQTVTATIVRDGRRMDVQVTPQRSEWDFASEPSLEQLRTLGPLADRLSAEFGTMLREPPPPAGTRVFGARGRLGVTATPLSDQLADYFGTKGGALVSSVSKDSPASRAGLQAGDVITSANGQPIRSVDDLVRAINEARSGAEIPIEITRNRNQTSVTVKLAERGKV
jgi:serine protease Do